MTYLYMIQGYGGKFKGGVDKGEGKKLKFFLVISFLEQSV